METESNYVKQVVALGRKMITLAENNEVFADDDAKWNQCVVAGNKLVTLGTPWGLQRVEDLPKELKQITTELGKEKRIDNKNAMELGWLPRNLEDTIAESAKSLIDLDLA